MRNSGFEGKARQLNEHLTEAITAYRNALEVYTRERLPQDTGPRPPEGFPAYHVRVEANLAKAEDLLEQAKAPQ
jgi:hypothetical protein